MLVIPRSTLWWGLSEVPHLLLWKIFFSAARLAECFNEVNGACHGKFLPGKFKYWIRCDSTLLGFKCEAPPSLKKKKKMVFPDFSLRFSSDDGWAACPLLHVRGLLVTCLFTRLKSRFSKSKFLEGWCCTRLMGKGYHIMSILFTTVLPKMDKHFCSTES